MKTLTPEERKELADTAEERFQRDREELEADLKALQKMISDGTKRLVKGKKNQRKKLQS